MHCKLQRKKTAFFYTIWGNLYYLRYIDALKNLRYRIRNVEGAAPIPIGYFEPDQLLKHETQGKIIKVTVFPDKIFSAVYFWYHSQAKY